MYICYVILNSSCFVLADSYTEVVILVPGSKIDFSFVASVAVAKYKISFVQRNKKSSSSFHLDPMEM